MNMTIRRHHRSGPVGLLRAVLALLVIASSGGCLIPETVSLDGPATVSQAIAKRDLGIDYLSSHRTAMAIRELRASLRLDPTDAQTHLWIGEAYRRKGKIDEAEERFLEAVVLSAPVHDSHTEQAAHLSLSALFSQMGRYEDAIEHCELLAADPTFASPWRPLSNCGWALYKLGRLEEAKAHFEEALDYFPRFGPALLNLGIVQTKLGHPLAAIATLDRALDSGRLGASALGETHYRLGELYVGLGRRDKAIEHFRAATDEAPYADWGTQSQAYLDLLK